MKNVLLGLLTGALLMAQAQASAEVAVVVAKDNTAVPSKDEISRIFLGKLKQFDGGIAAHPIYAKEGTSTRDEFNQKVLGKSSSQLKAYWSKLLFSGKGTPPKEFASDSEIINEVTSKPGAIGYIDASSVTDAVRVISNF